LAGASGSAETLAVTSSYQNPLAFADFHDIDPATLLLSISTRLVCSGLREQKAQSWPEPYAIGPR
jgi:hypothetical protein